MTRYILDTGIAGLYLARKRGVLERAQDETARGDRVGIAGPVLAELAFRAEGSPQRDRKLRTLRQALDVWKLWLPDTRAFFEYGRIAFALKSIGRPLGQNDIMIAAIALTLGDLHDRHSRYRPVVYPRVNRGKLGAASLRKFMTPLLLFRFPYPFGFSVALAPPAPRRHNPPSTTSSVPVM